jgi:hypothetical protein
MPFTKYLSETEKQYGRRCMVIEESINGIAFPLLGDTLVYLLAVAFQAGNFALGYISSAAYIGGIVLPIVPLIFQGKNQIKCQAFAWYARSLCSLGYLAVLFLNPQWARIVLLVVFTLFCVFRMIGIAFNDFTVKSISSVSNRGRVVSEVNIAYQLSSMFFRLITSVVLTLQFFATVLGMVSLQMFGVAANLVSSRFVGKIPCRSTVQYTKGHGVTYQVRASMRNPSLRRRLFLRWFSTVAIIVFNMTVPYLRVVLHLSSSWVMFYSVTLGLAVVCAGLATKDLADRIGSKPLVFISGVASLFCLFLWAVFPVNVDPLWYYFLGFVTNFFLSSVNLLVVRLIAQVMPDDDAVPFNAMVNFVIALFALAAGFLSGLMANFSSFAENIFVLGGKSAGNPYTLVFLFAMVMDLVVVVISTRLQEVGSYSTKDAAGVVFSLHGIQAVSMIERLQKTKDPTKRRELLLSLGSNLNNLATSELREILANPFSPDTEDAIRSLGEKPRPALLDDLIRIAEDDDSYVQLNAIGALGSYRGPKARTALEGLLEGHWSSVRSMASRSLARQSGGDSRYLDIITRLSLNTRHIDEEIDYLIAKREIDKEGTFYQDFFLSVTQQRSATFRQTRYAVLASFLKFGSPRLAYLYELMNNGDVDDFLSDFLTDARDLSAIDQHYNDIFEMFETENWMDVRTFCLSLLDDCDVTYNPRFENLRKGLLKAREMDIALFDVQDALAELYFGYSLEKNSHSA